ncbi:polysaccharide deacetylase family protein [Zavarzinella formosa]|uniref:polysaccharide deacetylase family protein n=1 Tax=Zavarzinella formosa TaxID=360055 RepID=UPI00030736CA|nr:polysaccharide deacetylase family protein [Zavarzinella formosa]
MMFNHLLRKGRSVSHRLLGHRRMARRTRASVAVVMYHGVTREPLPFFNWCQLDAGSFEQQMRFLADEYAVLPLTEVVDRLTAHRPLPEHTAVVTFDDGFRNVATTAYPIMERHQIHSTVFVVTGLVGTHQPPWTDRLFQTIANTPVSSVTFEGTDWPLTTPERRSSAHRAICKRLKQIDNDRKEEHLRELFRQLGGCPEVSPDSPLATMGWDEIGHLSRGGLISFGSHTHTHPILSRCSPEAQREELTRSRDILRDRLGSADLFAYPNGTRGDFTDDTKRLLAETGYRCGLATVPGLNGANADLFELRRVNVGADEGFSQFQLNMIGW